MLADISGSVNILNMQTFNEINNRLPKPWKSKATKTKVCTYRKEYVLLKIFHKVDTVIETDTKFSKSIFFAVETKVINSLSGVASLALGLIKSNKSEHMCFTFYNMKNDNTQKEVIKLSISCVFSSGFSGRRKSSCLDILKLIIKCDYINQI